MTATIFHLHPHHHVGPVDRRVFGGFLEHMGRAVYEGVFDPTSPHADESGCRTDVLDALRRLEFTVMRYPGGNFVSNYHWRDGIGPVGERPVRRELAWGTIEPNTFGTDEFLALAARMDWIPMLAVNLGTGTAEEAADWLEYCNGTARTEIVDLRRQHGREEPWAVPLWCLGNEMDGPWQIGNTPVHEYGVLANQTAHMMKWLDPSIELVVSGSSHERSPTWMSWDRQALEAVAGRADHLSTHRYLGNGDGDTDAYLMSGTVIDRQIEEMDAVCRYVAGVRRSRRRPYIAFDEWNVWYRTNNPQSMERGGQFPMPLIEEVYDLQDALVVAQCLMSFIRHADVVKIANLAQIVNVIAPVLTRGDGLLLQTIFHALEMFAGRREGVSLRLGYEGPRRETDRFGTQPVVDGAAILGGGFLHTFAVNRDADRAHDVEIRLAGATIDTVASASVLHHDDVTASNTWDEPEAVTSQAIEAAVTDGQVRVALPPHSFVALTAALS